MKKLIAFALVALSFMSFAPVATAQHYGGYAYCNGVYRVGNCGGPIYTGPNNSGVIAQNVTQMGGTPVFVNGGGIPSGGFSTCTTVGALGGGTLGSLADKHRGQAIILGAIIGGVVGNWACGLSTAQQRVVQQPIVSGRIISAEEQVGGFAGSQVQRPRTITEPSDCDIEGRPELQNLRITHDQCKAIRSALTVKEPSDCDVGAAKDMKGLSQAQCDAIRVQKTEKRDGHCTVGGVNYPHLVDNEPGCLAMRGQVKQAAIEKAKPHSYGKVAEAARNAQGYPCFVGSKDGDLLADFMVLTKNPYGEIATTGPKCKALVERFRTENGGTIAQN